MSENIKVQMAEHLEDTVDDTIEKFIEFLEKKEFKSKLIREINKNIDIPIINEKTEKKIINSLYDTIIKSIKKLND